MKALGFYKKLFCAAAVYDGVLGLSFFLFYTRIYEWFSITPPNHPGYVQLPALFIAIMGVADGCIVQDPVRNRDLVMIRLLMKLAFSLLCFYHYFFRELPTMWVMIAVFNLVFIVPYSLFLRQVQADVLPKC